MSDHIHASSDDVIVRISRPAEMYQMFGTRAALMAEGVVPADLEWPQGFKSEWWDLGQLRYRLSRHRPSGAKGPRRDFLEVDWWAVTCFPRHSTSWAQREVARRDAELRRARYRASEAGAREWTKFCERYHAMTNDKAYQAFMGKVLGTGKRLFRLVPRFDLGGAAS